MTAAIERFEREAHRFVPKALRARAELFDRTRFREVMRGYVEARLAERTSC